MQSNILGELCQTSIFSHKLITIIQSVRKSISTGRWSKNSIKQAQHHLISLTCQNKNLLHYKYLQEKSNNQRCLAHIVETLVMNAKMWRQSRENIVCLFLSHILSHTSCYISYYCFYIIMESVPEIIQFVSYQSLFEINNKIKKQQNGENFKILQSIRINESEAFTNENIQLCQRNLDNYLWAQSSKSGTQARQREKPDKGIQSKIPPLMIPTSKSINSSRYSISREQKRKGLSDLQKLASGIGESFITVQLGCLLANKRTRQIQQFSQNQVFRQKCLQKLQRIETQRMNSSRLTMDKTALNQMQQIEQNAKKYYRKVLTVNLNMCLKKLPDKFKIMQWINKKIDAGKRKTETNSQQVESQYYIHFLQQIFDMIIVGMINPSLREKPKNSQKQDLFLSKESGIFSLLARNLKGINTVAVQMIQTINIQVQKLHLNLLLNRNKTDSNSYYSFENQNIVIRDEFLQDVNLTINEPVRLDGQWKQNKRLAAIKKLSEPMLLYLGSWLQSLQQSADMSHPMFYFYQTNILKSIAFYLSSSQSKVSNYYMTQYLFCFFLMIKREIIELSHPYINSTEFSKSSRQPLSHKNTEMVEYFLLIISSLVEGANRHLEKLISHVFVKNIYFMETIQNYFENIVKEQRIPSIVNCLSFYSKCLEVYCTSTRKSPNNQKNNDNSPSVYLFQHIADYLCPRTGCISKALIKYQSFISPTNLEEYDEQQLINEEKNKFNTQVSGSLLGFAKKSEDSIQHYLHQIFLFISQVYYRACPTFHDSTPLLEEDICSFYIKYSTMNFIKLYSLLTVKQLSNISNTKQNNELDYMMSTKQSPHGPPKINTKQIFMIDFLKILTNISINRTVDISKKFYQYRVLEFFAREIQLEFSVKQNIQKYIKRAVKLRTVEEVIEIYEKKQMEYKRSSKGKQISSKDSFPKQEEARKISVPGLNLGESLSKKEEKQERKETTGVQKQKKMFIPSLNIPQKTEQNISSSGRKDKERSKKGILDDLVQQIQLQKNPKKKSFKEQLNLKLDNLSVNINSREKSIGKSKSPKSSDSNIIYFTERKIRKIYSNKILHAESIILILSLLLYKGQLDPIYCDQMPIIHGKINVLYILHYHLNHEKNRAIIPFLAEYVAKIKPALSGQRLFKLLSNHFTDLSHYYDWNKINSGAFGVIMSAKTHIVDPKQVAIKQMNFPKSIYERCVLNDIFTQITTLQMFRLEERVTRMYNYGVFENTYVIIMKKYACSLRDWRIGNAEFSQAKLYPPTLPNILGLFYQVIKGLKLLHEQNVTHYDIKGDNILLQFLPVHDPKQPPKINIVFADFGVSKIYHDQNEQLDLKSRGTQCIKSPQMLTLALKNKKQSDSYDRRKKIGTTKASDIWSLGCLLYQIITGQFLFNSNDWVRFFMQVTSPNEDILNNSNCEKMKNNVYLIDFIKYILIRDPHHRPSIQSIQSRFENLYSLLVANPERTASTNLRQINSKNLDEQIKQYYSYMAKRQRKEGSRNLGSKKRLKSEGEFGRTRKVMEVFNIKISSKITKIMEDIYFCDREAQITQDQSYVQKQGITHIIVETPTKINKSKFKVVEIQTSSESFEGDPQSDTLKFCYKLGPRISDILREVLLLKGKLLFVNSQSNLCVNLLIFTLSYWFKCSAYQTWCLINTQILEFPAFNSSIADLSEAVTMISKIEQEIHDLPKLQCICGSVTIILRKKFHEKRGDLKVCKCRKGKNQAGCFMKNCPNYLQLIQKRYNIVWDHLTWTLANQNQLLTPIFQQGIEQKIKTQILLNSANPLSNMITDSKENEEWKIYQCKTCQMWMLATDKKQIWLILNNLIKASRQGIMIPNAQQEYKTRTPALNYYTLSKLHMTNQ